MHSVGIRIGLVAIAACFLQIAPASAGTILDCGPDGSLCGLTVAIDGQVLGQRTFAINPESGNISLASRYGVDSGESTFWIDSISGNADPILGFATSASTGAAGASFSLTMTLPIALTGPIDANSSIAYTLTSLSAAGAQIAPLIGSTVLTAQEVDSSVGGIANLDKGVNVGDVFFFTGGPQTQVSPVYTASNQIIGDLAYDLMVVTTAFTLSPNTTVGVSGFVQQVPEPGTASLLVLGLMGFAAVRRRR